MFGKKKKEKPMMFGFFLLTCFALSIGAILIEPPKITDNSANNESMVFDTDGLSSPRSNAIETDNSYTGDGAPLLLNEWADSTNTTTGLSIIDAQTTTTEITLAEGWEGYAMETYVYDVFETESWVSSYSFPADGNNGDYINNGVWTWDNNPVNTYHVEVGGEAQGGGRDYVWVDLNQGDRGRFSVSDDAWWEQDVYIPRGEIVQAWIAFEYWTGTMGVARCPYADFNVYANVNGQKIFNIPSPDMVAANSWGDSGLYEVPVSVINSLPSTPGTINIRVGAYCA
ncbi:MAG: hypothetical protein ACFFCS_19185, partial [Candidatus Hodarchaeota archaeon]